MLGENNSNKLPLSKIKQIAIELKDYHYFHSPYQIKHQREHYIGRRKKIEQFKEVIMDASTDSGNYLVTGYRRSGKTSFVNMVLADITILQRQSNRSLQLWRLFFILTISIHLLVLNLKVGVIIAIFLSAISTILLCLYDPHRPTSDRKRKKLGLLPFKKSSQNLLNRIRSWVREKRLALFYISCNENTNDTLINLCRGILVLSIISIFALLFVLFIELEFRVSGGSEPPQKLIYRNI